MDPTHEKPNLQPAPEPAAPARSADSEDEVEDPVRIRPFEGPSGTPGSTGGGGAHVIHPVHPSSDPYPGVHVH